MHVPVEVLALVACAVVILLVAVWAERVRIGRLEAAFAARLTVARPEAPTPEIPSPAPGPHAHVWATEPTAVKGYWREYACTVPGCTADPLTKAGTP